MNEFTGGGGAGGASQAEVDYAVAQALLAQEQAAAAAGQAVQAEMLAQDALLYARDAEGLAQLGSAAYEEATQALSAAEAALQGEGALYAQVESQLQGISYFPVPQQPPAFEGTDLQANLSQAWGTFLAWHFDKLQGPYAELQAIANGAYY